MAQDSSYENGKEIVERVLACAEDLCAYVEFTRTTAVYPGRGTDSGRLYVALGLTGEAGEVAEARKKELRDGVSDESRVLYELGDVLWYLARACEEGDVTMHRVLVSVAQESFFFSISGDLGLIVLAQYAGQLGEHLVHKKASRDWVFLFATRAARLLTHIEKQAMERGMTLSALLEMNRSKLTSRKNRGVLHGSGDTR